MWNTDVVGLEHDGELHALSELLWRRHGPGSVAPLLHSVWANAQPARGNAILSGDWRLLRSMPGAADPFTWQVTHSHLELLRDPDPDPDPDPSIINVFVLRNT